MRKQWTLGEKLRNENPAKLGDHSANGKSYLLTKTITIQKDAFESQKTKDSKDSSRERGSRILDLDLPSLWTTKSAFSIYQSPFLRHPSRVAQMSRHQHYNEPWFYCRQGFMQHNPRWPGISDLPAPSSWVEGFQACLWDIFHQLSSISSPWLHLPVKEQRVPLRKII